MEYVCGCRFCFKCGTANATCWCTPPDHVFWDNIRHCNSRLKAESVTLVDLDASTNTLGTMIGRRKRLEDNRLKRETRNRIRQSARSEIGSIDRAPMYTVSICNGSWLFKPKDSITYLQRIMEIRKKRLSKLLERHIQLLDRDPDEPSLSTVSASAGLWLFRTLTTRGSIRMLDLIVHLDVAQKERRTQRTTERIEFMGVWDPSLLPT
jgi:hypothetical protein